jgi:hypothetical protein
MAMCVCVCALCSPPLKLHQCTNGFVFCVSSSLLIYGHISVRLLCQKLLESSSSCFSLRSTWLLHIILFGLLLLLFVFWRWRNTLNPRHYKEEAEIASMTWKIAWNEVVLFSGDRTGRSSGGAAGGPSGVGKFGSRLSIGRNSILVHINTYHPTGILVLRQKHKFRINFLGVK